MAPSAGRRYGETALSEPRTARECLPPAPGPGMPRTLLLGKCMFQKHRDNPTINQLIAVRGCPPRPADVVKALHQAGIPVDAELFARMDQLPGLLMARYTDRPEFDEGFFRVDARSGCPPAKRRWPNRLRVGRSCARLLISAQIVFLGDASRRWRAARKGQLPH